MKNPSSGDPSPFSSSSHDPGLSSQPTQNQPATNQPVTPSPTSNLPASAQKIMAANASGATGGGARVIAPSYKPSGKVGPNALPVMLIATVLGGLVAAAAYYFIAPHFNFVLVTQAYLGAIVGAFLWMGVKAGKVRSQRYSSVFAVLGTLLLFGAYHGASVWREREDILDFYSTSIAKATKTSVPATRARLAQRFTYARATQLYWKDLYTNGVTLRDSHSSSRSSASTTGTHIAGLGYIVFLLAEIGMTALAAAIVASIATTARFSESQDKWYSKKRVFAVGNKEVWPVLEALQQGDWTSARQIATERKLKVADVGQVYVSTVPGDPNGWVEMTITQDKQQKLLFESEVNADALRALGAKI